MQNNMSQWKIHTDFLLRCNLVALLVPQQVKLFSCLAISDSGIYNTEIPGANLDVYTGPDLVSAQLTTLGF